MEIMTSDESMVEGPVAGPVLVLYYPPGECVVQNFNTGEKTKMLNREIAKGILESIRLGGSVTLPVSVDIKGHRVEMWRLVAAFPDCWKLESFVPKT